MLIKVLKGNEVRQALPMAAAIQAVEEAFIQYSSGLAEVPRRIGLSPKGTSGTTLFMPAYIPSLSALGAKVISIFPANIPKRIPTIHALVVMFDPETGSPLGLLDGSTLTAIRTGAASGVATRHLSRRDSAVLAIFGAGIQGQSQVEAVCTVRAIRTVLVFDPLTERARHFARALSKMGAPVPADVHPVPSPAEAVRPADIICTATTARNPVFDDRDLKPGVHINAIGSYQPHVQEIPAETVQRAKVVVDSIETSLAEAGDFIIPMKAGLFAPDRIQAEIGRIASGERPGRADDLEVTLFKSVGLAVQDMAAAARALQGAARLGLGSSIEV